MRLCGSGWASYSASSTSRAASIPCWEQMARAGTLARPSARIALGRALQEEGRLAEAREHYLKADELQPHASQPQINLGWLHELKGDMDEAEAAFRRAIVRQPKLPAAHARLASLLRGKLPNCDVASRKTRLSEADLGDAPALTIVVRVGSSSGRSRRLCRGCSMPARSQRVGPQGRE